VTPRTGRWGDRDRVLPARHLEAARRLIPHADTHLFTGIGHMPQIECPAEFSALVLGCQPGHVISVGPPTCAPIEVRS
jgi:pimeloyl-ACP methyl ester carboxylesterase